MGSIQNKCSFETIEDRPRNSLVIKSFAACGPEHSTEIALWTSASGVKFNGRQKISSEKTKNKSILSTEKNVSSKQQTYQLE